MMEGITPPDIARRLGETRSRVDRILEQYAVRLPKPVRAGNARFFPVEVVELVREILATEARCAEGWR
jgi:hypothetical protein